MGISIGNGKGMGMTINFLGNGNGNGNCNMGMGGNGIQKSIPADLYCKLPISLSYDLLLPAGLHENQVAASIEIIQEVILGTLPCSSDHLHLHRCKMLGLVLQNCQKSGIFENVCPTSANRYADFNKTW